MPFKQKLSTDSGSSHLLWAEDKCSVTWLWFRQAWSFLFALHLATLSLVFSRRSRTLNTTRSSNKMLNLSACSNYKSTHKICQQRLRQRFLQFPAPAEVSAPQLIPAELIFFIEAEIFGPRPHSLAGRNTRGCGYSRRDQAAQLWQSIWAQTYKYTECGSTDRWLAWSDFYIPTVGLGDWMISAIRHWSPSMIYIFSKSISHFILTSLMSLDIYIRV